jgi:predicted kinase
MELHRELLNAWLEQSGAYDALAALPPSMSSTAPALIITHGLSAAGKTTIASELGERLGALLVRIDVEHVRLRRQRALLGDRSPLAVGVLADRLALLATQVISAGWPVIVEACFLTRATRERFRGLARALRVPFAIVECSAPLAVIRERLGRRCAFGSLFHGQDTREAELEAQLHAQLEQLEALDDRERAHAVSVDTSAKVDYLRLAEQLAALAKSIAPVVAVPQAVCDATVVQAATWEGRSAQPSTASSSSTRR